MLHSRELWPSCFSTIGRSVANFIELVLSGIQENYWNISQLKLQFDTATGQKYWLFGIAWGSTSWKPFGWPQLLLGFQIAIGTSKSLPTLETRAIFGTIRKMQMKERETNSLYILSWRTAGWSRYRLGCDSRKDSGINHYRRPRHPIFWLQQCRLLSELMFCRFKGIHLMHWIIDKYIRSLRSQTSTDTSSSISAGAAILIFNQHLLWLSHVSFAALKSHVSFCFPGWQLLWW